MQSRLTARDFRRVLSLPLRLFAASSFALLANLAPQSLAQPTGWNTAVSGLNADAYAMTLWDDDGPGPHEPQLVVAGNFTTAGGAPANRIAKWNGSAWSSIGSGITFNSTINAICVFDEDGAGPNPPQLFIAGDFTVVTQGGTSTPINRIAKWNGSAWVDVGPAGAGINGFVPVLHVSSIGGAPALYAGGLFSTAGGVSASGIAKWNGTSWSALGAGVTFPGVYAMADFNDGSGSALFAAGIFPNAGGSPASHIAKWNGTAWSPLGAGLNGNCWSLATFDDGGGTKLYAGGAFTTAGGNPASHLAKWNGSAWSTVASTGGEVADQQVYALAVHDSGSGPALYAGGDFAHAGGVAASHAAAYKCGQWLAMSGGCDDRIYAFQPFASSALSPASLYACGAFLHAGGSPASHIASWLGPDPCGDIRAFGFIHQTIGDATHSYDSAARRYPVHPLGSSGVDGVSVDVGRCEGWHVLLDPVSVPDGSSVEYRFFGTDAGPGPNHELMAERITTTNGVHTLEVGFDGGTATLDAYFHGVRVYHQEGMGGQSFRGWWRRFCDWVRDHVSVDIDLNPDDPSVSIDIEFGSAFIIPAGGGPTIECDLFTIRPDSHIGLVPPLTRVDMLGASVPTFTVTKESCELFHQAIETTGNAALALDTSSTVPATSTATVSNIGASCCDGVLMSFTPSASCDYTLATVDPSSTAPVGAFMRAYAKGGVNGDPNHSLGWLSTTKLAGPPDRQFEINVDYSAINSPTQLVQVLSGSTVIGSFPGHSGIVGYSSRWPWHMGKLAVNGIGCISYDYPPFTFITVNGTTFSADHIRVLSESATRINFLSAYGIEAAGIGQFTITDGTAPSCLPAITTQPTSQTIQAGTTLIEDVAATSASALTYQWRWNFAPLSNGPHPAGGTVSGATTSHLQITGLAAAASGSYDCIITNTCGPSSSDVATVIALCPADFNNDGGIDGADVEAFFAAWEGGQASADVNLDGGIDGADVGTFFAAWEGGGC